MSEFEALVHSLGEQLVAYIGKEQLQQVELRIDEYHSSATANICLTSDSFDAVMHAIDKVGEVRMMFMDEVSLDYVLTPPGDCPAFEGEHTKALVFV